MARLAFGISAALAALSLAAAVTQPDKALTGVAAVAPVPTTNAPTGAPVPTTAAAPVVVVTTAVPPPPTTTAPRPAAVAAPPTSPPPAPTTPTTARSYASSGARESCGWSWDATHFDDGSLNEVSIVMQAPRRPNSPVTMTAKPGASAPTSVAATTDGDGFASMLVSLSNDKRDWTLTIGAQFAGSSCDARTFTIAY